MSRMQNILEKAERDGAVHRLHSTDGLTAAIAEPAVMPTPAAFVHEVRATTAIPAGSPLRTFSGGRLDRLLITATAPDAPASEQYRALRTRILYSDTRTMSKLLLVTSPATGDGKSLTAANLALVMAQEPTRRVCLVDANLRAPRAQRLFGLPEGDGLSDVLVGHALLDDVVVQLEEYQLAVVPAGYLPANPAELLGTTAMRRVLETLRARFDQVIVDAPAVAPLADVGILTPLVDAIVMVVRAGQTPKPAIEYAMRVTDATKLMGVILNETGA